MKNKKVKLSVLILTLVLVISSVFAFGALAEEETKAPEIISMNVEYSERLALMYAVDAASVADGSVTLQLYYNEPTEGATPDKTYTKAAPETIKVDGNDVSAFVFTTGGVAAKDMADIFYVKAVDAKGNESKVVRYSVVEYLNERLLTEGITEAQERLYKNALAFGASAQAVLKPDETLATDYAYVRLEGGAVFADGYSAAIFPKGTVIEPIAPENELELRGWSFGKEFFEIESPIVANESMILTPSFTPPTILTYEKNSTEKLPEAIGNRLLTQGASVTVEEVAKDGGTTKALAFTTAKGNNDYLYVYKTEALTEGYVATVFETDILINYDASAADTTLQFYLGNDNDAYAYQLNLVRKDSNLAFRDYSHNDNTKHPDRISGSLKVSSAKPGEWFNIRIVYIYGDSDGVRIATYINGSLLYDSVNYYGKNAPAGTEPSSDITRVSLVPYGQNVSTTYLDNTSLRDVVSTDGAYDFESSAETPDFITTAPGKADANGEFAQFGVIEDASGNGTNVYKFYSNVNTGSSMTVTPNTQYGHGSVYVFETDFRASMIGGTKTFYLYFRNADNSTVYQLAFTREGSNNVLKMRDYSKANGFGPALQLNSEAWSNLRVEYFGAKDKADVMVRVYLDGNLVYVSNNVYDLDSAANYSVIDKVFVQTYSDAIAELRFDNIYFSREDIVAPTEPIGTPVNFENAAVDTQKRYYVYGSTMYSWMGAHGSAYGVKILSENNNKYLSIVNGTAVSNGNTNVQVPMTSLTAGSYNAFVFESDMRIDLTTGNTLYLKFGTSSGTNHVIRIIVEEDGSLSLNHDGSTMEDVSLGKKEGEWFKLRIEYVTVDGATKAKVYVGENLIATLANPAKIATLSILSIDVPKDENGKSTVAGHYDFDNLYLGRATVE